MLRSTVCFRAAFINYINLIKMKNFRRVSLLALFSILSFSLFSQENSSVPTNPEIKFGKLENGMTYYIKSNSEPEKRASFYIIQNVGALLENSDQNGLAHFLEHMAFNGTKHFPDKGIINFLEKHGVAFGYNINAYTSFNETVYNLSDVPVEKPGLVDSCLLVLNDWSNYLLLTGDEIEAERGVITEEWRTRRNADFRMMKKYMPVLLKDSKFAERDIIGDLDIIKTFDHHTIRDFYHDWYRTDLQAIAIVGDFDAAEMENKVKELFSQIPSVSDPKPRPFFDVPEHAETLYALVTDSEASQNSVDMYIKVKSFDPEQKGTSYLREQYIRTLFNSMASKRVGELLQKGVPPFVTGTIRYGGFVRGYDVFSIAASSKANEEQKAFKAIYTEAERIRRFGFTQGELDRAKTTMLTNWENYYNERDKIDNDSYISSIQEHFLNNEPIPSVEYEYDMVKKMVPGITLQEVSARAGEWMTEKNRVIIVTGPEEEGITHMTEEESITIIKEITTSDLEPYIDEAAGSDLIGKSLNGSTISTTVKLDQFDAVEWTLANGVRVIFKKADFEKDNVSLSAFSPGGASLVSDDLVPEVSMLPTFTAIYGAGEFDNITLQKMLTGKKASLSISVGEVTENITGSSTPKDFETMMQLLYLRFENPRFDEESHNALMERYKAFLSSMNNNPQKVMQDSVSLILSDYHPRSRVLDQSFLEDIEYKNIETLYRDRIADADDFTFIIVGNIEEEIVKPLVEKYIGSLTSTRNNEKWVDHHVNQPEGTIKRVVPLTLTDPKSTVFINYSTKMPYNPYNRQAIRVLNGILDMIYVETIREEEGGTYGVSTSISLQQFPAQKANATIMFDCDPVRAEELKAKVYSEIEKIMISGPTKEHLDKAVNNVLKNREESMTHNSYWSSTLYSWYFSGIDYNNPENYEKILQSLTPEDIKELAKKLFENADLADILFVPKEN
jgi:zinc protease